MSRTLVLLAEFAGFTLLVRLFSAPFWRLFGSGIPGGLGGWLMLGVVCLLLGAALNGLQRGAGFRDLGFRFHRSFRGDIGFGVVGYAALYIVSLPFDLIALPDHVRMVGQMAGQFPGASARAIVGVGNLVALVLGFTTGAFHEEIRFRGYYQGSGAKELTPLAGFIIALIPSSLGHGFPNSDWSVTQVLATVIPGVMFGVLFNATGSLVVVMTVHTLTNWIGSFPALVEVATRSHTAGVATACGILLPSLALVALRWRREVSLCVSATLALFREDVRFGLISGVSAGAALLALWAWRPSDVYSGAVGLVLTGAAVWAKRALRAKAA
jgi:membrane protease YdiL (CAAX protease family)